MLLKIHFLNKYSERVFSQISLDIGNLDNFLINGSYRNTQLSLRGVIPDYELLSQPWPHLTLSLPSSKSALSQPFEDECKSDVVRIGTMIIFHLSKLWKAKFFILCDAIFLVRLQGKFEIDLSWE